MNKRFVQKTALCLFSVVFLCSCGGDDDNPPPPQNNAPVIQDQTASATENISDTARIIQVVATDPDDDDLTFSIFTNDNNLFEITDSGELSLAPGQNLDFETKTSHSIAVAVTDGSLSSNATITVTVNDVDETSNSAPVFDAQTFSVQENVTGRGFLVATLAATDPDNDDITFSWDPNVTVTAFELNSTTGEIRTVNNAQGDLDFETTPQYVVSVIATDGELSTQADITINVTDFNDKPVFGGGSFSVAEDVDDATIFATLVATDQDGDALTFAIQSDPDNLFEITNGVDISLQAGKSLDYETAVSHTIEVSVTDGTETVINTVNINVTDVAEAPAGSVSTFAGSTAGNTDDTGAAAQFNFPEYITIGPNGNFFVTDNRNNKIRQITPNGLVSTFYQFGSVSLKGLVFDSNGNLFVADALNHVIWRIDVSGGVATQYAGRSGSSGSANGFGGSDARFNSPHGITINANDELFIADKNNNAIRRIGTNRIVTTIASINSPEHIVTTSDGSVYVSSSSDHFFGRITSSGGSNVTLLIGEPGVAGDTDGAARAARLDTPGGMVADGNFIYLAGFRNQTIRKIDLSNNSITTIAGGSGLQGNADGTFANARFRNPIGITIDGSGDLFVVDNGNHCIRKIDLQ